MQEQTPNTYLKSLDGLRLFASVNIVLLHIYTQRPLSYTVSTVFSIPDFLIYAPAFNASIFFLLSGFIFTYKYAGTGFSAKDFLIGRFKKLYPLHIITTSAMALILIIMSIQTGYLNTDKLFISLSMHLSLLWSFYPLHTYRLNLPSWSLSGFLLCYLLFPFFLKLVCRIKKRGTVLLLAAACLIPGIIWTIVYSIFNFDNKLFLFFHTFAPVRFFEFLIGMFLARFFILYRGRITILDKKPYINTAVILISIILIFFNVYLRFSSNRYIYWLSYHTFCIIPYSAVIFCLAKGKGIICRFTQAKLIRRLGRISFYTYILHFPFIFFIPMFFTDFLFSPLKITIFIILLYGCSLLLAEKIKPVLFKSKSIKKPHW